MASQRSELFVITTTKRLIDYVFEVSDKSPKKFRFSLLSKMHVLLLEALELLYEANIERLGSAERKKKQDLFRVKLALIGNISDIGQRQGCFTFHQYETMAKQIRDCDHCLKAWVKSDLVRAEAMSNQGDAT